MVQVADSRGNIQPDASGRTAIPSISIGGDIQYFVSAKSSDKTVYGLVDSANKTFSITLDNGIEWTLTAGVKNGDEIVMESDPFTKVFTQDDIVIDHKFIIKPAAEGIGSVKLVFNASSDIVSVMVLSDDNEPSDPASNTIDFMDGKATLALEHVPCGTYKLTLKFKDNKGQYLYVHQTVNVFPNMETNYWVSGDGLDLISAGEFSLSDDFFTAASRTIFYVGQTGVTDSTGKSVSPADSNDGSAYSPLSSLEEAIMRAQNAYAGIVDYTIYLYSDQNLVSGSYEIDSNNIASLLIEGKGAAASTITGNSGGSVFSVSSAKPVTFKNVKITGGNAVKGGGLFVDSGADVTLANGTELSGNTATETGNQLYVAGKLSLTSDNEMTPPSGECTGTTAGLEWAFEDGSTFDSSKQALVTVKTGWAKGLETEFKILAVKGNDMPTLTTTNPPANHPAALGDFKRTGYDLMGFYTGTGGSGTKYYKADGSSAATSDLDSDTTLYAWWRAKGEVLLTTSAGKTLVDGYYIVSDDVTCNHPINSGITIDGSVNIYIEEGCTLTSQGSSGDNANGRLAAGGGKAGILLTSGNTLKLFGYGEVVANGGAGGNAAAGLSNLQDAWMERVSRFKGNGRCGTGGAGGGGAGGGGAGIGTNGAAGGNGGFGGAGRTEDDFNNHGNCDAASDVGAEGNGGNGSSSDTCGSISAQTTITILATGGASGIAGASGTVLTDSSSCGEGQATNYCVDDSGSGFSYNWTCGPGGAGGGGGAGTNGADIGTGGAGGGGGGGGAGGSLNSTSSGHPFIGGHGGAGGSSGGGKGQEKIDDTSRSSASAGSGGSAGTGGIVKSLETLP